jgi:hypothetical protein
MIDFMAAFRQVAARDLQNSTRIHLQREEEKRKKVKKKNVGGE